MFIYLILCSKLNGSKDQKTNWCNITGSNKIPSSGSYEEKILSVWVSFTVFGEVRDAVLLLLTIGNFPSKESFLVNRVSLAYRWVGWSVDRSVIWSVCDIWQRALFWLKLSSVSDYNLKVHCSINRAMGGDGIVDI